MESLKILVVDDEDTIRKQLETFLVRNHYHVRTAGAPSEALARLAAEDIDVVILDINLPEMNGIQVLKRIKELNPRIEVIMITGQGDQESVLQSLKYGAFDFFYKPMSLLDIKASMERTNKYLLLHEKLELAENKLSSMVRSLEKEIGDLAGKSEAFKNTV